MKYDTKSGVYAYLDNLTRSRTAHGSAQIWTMLKQQQKSYIDLLHENTLKVMCLVLSNF